MILLSVIQINPDFPDTRIRIKGGVICNHGKYCEIITNSYFHVIILVNYQTYCVQQSML